MGAKDNIKFPTLEVRDPNELAAGPIQNSIFTDGPVYISTENIKEKIREINAALEAKIEAEEEKFKEKIKEIEIPKEVEVMTDVAAAEIVAEEIMHDIEEMANVKITESAIEAEAEELEEVLENLEQMADLKIAEALIEEEAEELAEDLVLSELGEMEVMIDSMVDLKVPVIDEESEEVEENIIKEDELNVETKEDPTMEAPEETEEEGSGKLPAIDFGDITEVSL